MRDASDRPARDGFTCHHCGRFIVTAVDGLWRTRRAGSARRFCDPACRQAAYRRRRAGVTEDTARQTTGGRNRNLKTPDSKEVSTTTPTRN